MPHAILFLQACDSAHSAAQPTEACGSSGRGTMRAFGDDNDGSDSKSSGTDERQMGFAVTKRATWSPGAHMWRFVGRPGGYCTSSAMRQTFSSMLWYQFNCSPAGIIVAAHTSRSHVHV